MRNSKLTVVNQLLPALFCTGIIFAAGLTSASAATPPPVPYDVWGGNAIDLNLPYCTVDTLAGWVKIGSTNQTATFYGQYSYYLIAVKSKAVLYLDAVQLSDGSYYHGTIAAGNISGDPLNVFGAPDGQFLALDGTIGCRGKTYASYAIFYNTGAWTSMRFFVYSPTSETRIIELSGDITFGNVPVGTNVQQTLTIANSGNSPLTVTSISYPDGFSGAWSGTIPAGQSQKVTVTFTPTGAPSYSGLVRVTSDATSGLNTVSISGFTPTQASYDVWGGNVYDRNLPYYDVENLSGWVKLGTANSTATFYGQYTNTCIIV